ncbi:hypothetical protein D3C75_674180 [compost metagenome]
MIAAQLQGKHQADHCPHQREGAAPVNALLGVGDGFLVGQGDQNKCDNANGQVDIEHPLPANIVGNVSAEKRTYHAGNTKDGAEESGQLASFFRGIDIEHNGEGNRHKRTSANPLNRPVDTELGDAVCGSAQGGANQEYNQAKDKKPLPAIHIGQLAEDRRSGHYHDHIGRGHPDDFIESAQIGNDGAHS